MDHAFAHRGDGSIQRTKQRTFPLAAQGFIQLEVAAGGCVQRHEFIQTVGAQRVQQVERIGLRLFEILNDRSRRADGEAVGFQPKAIQCGRLELRQQDLITFARLEFPGRHGRAVTDDPIGKFLIIWI